MLYQSSSLYFTIIYW